MVILISISPIVHAYSLKIIVHRGGGKEFPENTIIAFEEALKSGADSIELDIQLSKDEVIIVYHPRIY